MPELNIQIFSDFVRNADILWHKGFDSIPQVMRRSGLVKEIPVPVMTGNTREFSEVGLEEYARKKPEGDDAQRARVQQGYSKTATLKRYGLDISITYEMRTQGKYFEIKEQLTNLGKLVPNRLDLDLSHRIGFGSATTYTDMDGEVVDITVGDTLALYSTAHTLRASSTTFRNILANSPILSVGALEAMESMRRSNTYNQFGQKMTVPDDVLWTTDDPNTVNTAKKILQSSASTDQANAGVTNPYSGKYKHLILPRVATDKDGAPNSAKAKYWGVASTQYSTLFLGVHEEPRLKSPMPQGGTNAEDPSSDNWQFGTRGGYLICSVSAGWIGVSYGDGTP